MRDDEERRPMSDMAKLAILLSFIALCVFGCVKFVSYLDARDAQAIEGFYGR